MADQTAPRGRADRDGPLPVLMFHSIGSPMPPALADLTVPPALLDEQLGALREHGWRLRGLTEALDDPAPDVLALTFDDGYRDFADAAVDVLDRYDARATLYVPSDDLGGHASWMPPPADRLPVLGAADLRDLADLPERTVEIGSHGAQHVPMDVLPRATATEHLARSKRVLEDATGRAVRSMCYPHGYHAAGLRRRVAACGYDNACEIGHRLHARDGDRFAVSRVLVGPQHDPDALLDLVAHGPAPLLPAVKRAAYPAWRWVRRAARRTGRNLT
ncbi:MAG: polysaccharide deacetylase [Nocardioides sp.]|nr:polysaccharide deacetylase [Nocardioides sp.]